jgi:hypothetical protein
MSSTVQLIVLRFVYVIRFMHIGFDFRCGLAQIILFVILDA